MIHHECNWGSVIAGFLMASALIALGTLCPQSPSPSPMKEVGTAQAKAHSDLNRS